MGDADNFDWQKAGLNDWKKIHELLEVKEKSKELLGVALTWQGSLIGGEFLLNPNDSSVIISLSINRKKNSGGTTDFEFYFDRINKELEKLGCKINNITTKLKGSE